MNEVNFKKYIFRIGLIFILLVSMFSSIYAVRNYKSINVMEQSGGLKKILNIRDGENLPDNIPSLNNSGSNLENNEIKSDNSQYGPNGIGSRNADSIEKGMNDKSQQDGNVGINGGRDTKFGSNSKQRGNNKNAKQGEVNGNIQRGGVDDRYLLSITIYSVLFLIGSCSAYCLIKRKNIKFNYKDEKFMIIILIFTGIFLRISASTLVNGHNDINLFKNWAETAANGFSQFYANARQADYPPVYIYILGCIGRIANIQVFNSYYILLLKIPSIIADVATAYFIYRIGKRFLNTVTSIFLATFYTFNPAIFIDSTFWGQVDSLFTLLIVISIYLLYEKKYVFSSVMFALSVLMKPQGIIFLPVLFFELVRQRKIRNFIYAAVSAVATIIAIIIPFSINEQSPIWIFNLYLRTISEYPYASVNAFNFFGLVGANYKNGNTTFFIFSYHTIGIMFIILTTLIGWILYIKGNDRKYISAVSLLQIAGVFTFSVGMHERYLFPAVALSILAFIYSKDRRFFIIAIGFSITSYINISTVFFKTNTSVFEVLLKVTSLFNVILVLYLVKVIIDNTVKKFSLKIDNKESELL